MPCTVWRYTQTSTCMIMHVFHSCANDLCTSCAELDLKASNCSCQGVGQRGSCLRCGSKTLHRHCVSYVITVITSHSSTSPTSQHQTRPQSANTATMHSIFPGLFVFTVEVYDSLYPSRLLSVWLEPSLPELRAYTCACTRRSKFGFPDCLSTWGLVMSCMCFCCMDACSIHHWLLEELLLNVEDFSVLLLRLKQSSAAHGML